jgi:hypothetical protein
MIVRSFAVAAKQYRRLEAEKKKLLHQRVGQLAIDHSQLLRKRTSAADSSVSMHTVKAGRPGVGRTFAHSVGAAAWESGVKGPGVRLIDQGGIVYPKHLNIFGRKRGALFIPLSDKAKKSGPDALRWTGFANTDPGGGWGSEKAWSNNKSFLSMYKKHKGLIWGIDFVFAKKARIRAHHYMFATYLDWATKWQKEAPEIMDKLVHNAMRMS